MPVPIADWQASAVTQELPLSMWGDVGATNINPSTPTVTGTIGVTLGPIVTVITNCTPEMVIYQIFDDRTVNSGDEYQLPLSQTMQPSANAPAAADSFADIAGVNEPAMVASRNALFAALQNLGINAWTNDPLPLMAANPGYNFADEPMEGSPVSSST
jgi:hypothetical protein